MNEVSDKIRTAIYTALNGNITYNSQTIGIFDEAPPTTAAVNYILFSTQAEDDQSNNSRFVTEGYILLDIVSIQSEFPNKSVLESISNSILTILRPTVTTYGITLPAGYNLTLFRRESANSIPMLQSSTGKVLRKVLRFSYRIQHS